MQPPHRRILALTGSRDWCHAAACTLIGNHPAEDIVWVGDAVPPALKVTPFARRQQLLGDEYGIAILDGWAGFDPEQFGAVSGTLRGGGVLLLLLPPLTEWPHYPDPALERIAVWPHTPATLASRFIARTIRLLQQHDAIEWIHQPDSTLTALSVTPPHGSTSTAARTSDQQQALDAIHHLMHGHRHRPLVLMADRGRGKSAALGIAATQLATQGVKHIIVTAPHRNAVTSLLARAPHDVVDFIPPDELLRNDYPCDLLLVDEAAAIPAPMLEKLLQHHARIIFATTVHGYEGSGRGFALRFFKTLDRVTPGWKLLQMNEPIRWSAGDPLEQLTYALLLLDAAPASAEQLASLEMDALSYDTLSSDELGNDALLRELFGLLVLAHYRTTPLDLRQLLDAPNLTVHVARWRSHIVGTAITLREGGFDDSLATQIYSGTRRPRGHLAPQSLAFHCGLSDAPRLVTERIMRIAVHPAAQQRGIGRALLAQVTNRASREATDYLSTSFGATPELLHFWQRSIFLPVRVGITREASSGAHSLLMLRPLSAAAMALFARARRRFLSALPVQLCDPLRELDTEIATQLLTGELPELSSQLDDEDWRDLYSFATTHRSYESCLGAIHKLVRHAIANPLLLERLTTCERQLLIAKVLQRQAWGEVNRYCQSSGKEDAVKLLRQAVHQIIQMAAAEWLAHFDRERGED